MARSLRSDSSMDTIVAVATGALPTAIGILRLSGKKAFAIQETLFLPRGKGGWRPAQLRVGHLLDQPQGAPLDEGLSVRFSAPKSVTGEDVVEFHLHGNPQILRQAMAACVACGARPAEPGEFTRRGFLNGRMDLAQAEAVAALISAEASVAQRSALQQLTGGLSESLARCRAGLLALLAQTEVALDYPDEDLETQAAPAILASLGKQQAILRMLIASHERGVMAARGARLVLAGLPNAGKSSLFNALLRRERALVSPHAGTTRDTIEATIELAGYPITLVDTAGLRETAEEVEALGIARSREEIAAASAVIFVYDQTADKAEQNTLIEHLASPPGLIVLNKCDQSPGAIDGLPAGIPTIEVSCQTQQGLDRVEQAILEILGVGQATEGQGMLIASPRQQRLLTAAEAAIARAIANVEEQRGQELLAFELQEAISFIDELTGKSGLDEEVLDLIFSQFCLGK